MIRVIENRDKSYSFECTEDEDQPGPAEACLLIAQHNIDKYGVHRKVEKLCAEGYGTVREQAANSVAADRAKDEADHWISTGKRAARGRSHREAR